jgi:hypothetical protein
MAQHNFQNKSASLCSSNSAMTHIPCLRATPPSINFKRMQKQVNLFMWEAKSLTPIVGGMMMNKLSNQLLKQL